MAKEAPIYETLREISKARQEGKYSDLLLVCEDEKMPVHKIIVCPQSPVIDKACNGPFKERGTGIYEIKDASIDTVRPMVEYMYTGQYSLTTQPDSGEPCGASYSIVFHARMFELADKYMIAGLQTLAASEFNKALDQEMDACKFLRSIPAIYSLASTSSDKLREAVVWELRRWIAWQEFDATVKEVFHEVTGNVPQFSEELLDSFLDSPLLGECSCCEGRTKRIRRTLLIPKCDVCGHYAPRVLGKRITMFPERSKWS
ncbi:BTB/POZ domain protein [Metarhizium guizhouense ARSEF 977]|uniref:BTB/POZ domain protein n=1 Tax=Metarhizium guizhouense (strain ARSEF 977) TaxID=1276136 RepID=A0A0B4GEU1_METGA|nr:BTB/POZ domain protein [Metarhizium guizhouense ARSEF 977]